MLTDKGHLLDISSWTRDSIEEFFLSVFKLKNTLSTRGGRKHFSAKFSHCGALLYFTQSSTRTFYSFQRACQIFGVQVSVFNDKFSSSVAKGESVRDTLKTLTQYSDLIISRTLEQQTPYDFAKIADELGSPKFVINAGNGMVDHPTQSLLDLYTIWETYRFDRQQEMSNLKVVVVGDLKRGRAVKSFIKSMCLFDRIHFDLVSSENLQAEEALVDHIRIKENDCSESKSLEQSLQQADIVYMTRMQDEYIDEGKSTVVSQSSATHVLTPAMVAQMKPSAMILHPLPRREELPEDIDQDSRAFYWRQEAQGLWVRAALINQQLSRVF